MMFLRLCTCFFFFFNDTATTEIYTLSLHDALPISLPSATRQQTRRRLRSAESVDPTMDLNIIVEDCGVRDSDEMIIDRKSTRLNSSHLVISYAVFCLKKKKK